MMKKTGRQTLRLQDTPSIVSFASVVGQKEGEGPIGHCFDKICLDAYFGEKSWEKAESSMLKECFELCCDKLGIPPAELDMVFSGDLLNQCVGSAFALKNTGVPHFGLYGACSTMGESMTLAAMALDGGFADRVCAATSSHFCSSERQYRFPLGYGGQRTPTAQWTVTASGCCIVSTGGKGPFIEGATIGKIQDFGIKDANNMGAAMAPAAIDTIRQHFEDFHRRPQDYDLIVTGDLGLLGKQIVLEQLQQDGFDLAGRYNDCGVMIFDTERQDVHAGGSGCGCSASVLCGHLLRRMREGELHRLLFCATGALLSPVSSWQGESIPGVCHAVSIVTERR